MSLLTRTIVGHPIIITENFNDLSNYFGLIKSSVLPARGLYLPVLPYRAQTKLLFPICRSCADACQQELCAHNDQERTILGTWCRVEIEKAIEKGYEVLCVHEVWHFPQTTDESFKDYVDTFLKIKQELSGYPKNCVTEDQKQRYVNEYFQVENIQLDRNNIKYNPGMRALSKQMLNSF